MTVDEYVQRLTEASNKKNILVQDILSLTKRQTEVITEDSIPMLNSFIDEKQVKIDAINKLDEEFSVYFQRLKQTLKISSLDELKDHNIKGIKELQLTIGHIMSLIKEIGILEKQNSLKANQVLNHLGNEIKKINQGKKAATGYYPTQGGGTPSYFMDKKK